MQAAGQIQVQYLVPVGAVKAFDVRTLVRLARLDVLDQHTVGLAPIIQRLAEELRYRTAANPLLHVAPSVAPAPVCSRVPVSRLNHPGHPVWQNLLGPTQIQSQSVFARQFVDIPEVAEKIWFVSLMEYDRVFFHEDENRVEPVDQN